MPETLFCPIRKVWVSSLPEERVRQALIQEMTLRLGYPLENFVLEKSLNQLPHLKGKAHLPKRRIDLIVFGKNLHSQYPLYPLLLVECKSIPLTSKTLRQIVGYNQFAGAYFIAAVNQNSAYFGWYNSSRQDYCFQEGLLSYEHLLKKAQIILIK